MHVRDDARHPAPPASGPRRADADLTEAVPTNAGPRPFGVYVHIPFCSRRCDYCAFATWTDRAGLMAAYTAACRVDIERAVAAGMAPATSVFFGGGTPSLLPPPLLISILAGVPRVTGAEVTVECNPETVSAEGLAAYREAGVTRISLGVQSLAPHVLRGLGRAHDPAAALAAAEAVVAAGFETWSIDLIFGGAGEGDADWRRTLEAVLALGPPHVSAYGLTVEPGTPLAADPARHPDDDTEARRYVMADAILSAAGLNSYEISNWARPGHRCRHNLLYWAQHDYRGFGCAAHSHTGGHRWWNVRTPERYLAAIEAGESPVAGGEHLDPVERHREAVWLSLRTSDGVAVGDLEPDERRRSVAVAPLVDAGLVRVGEGRVVLTRRGRLLANEVATRLA